MPFNMQLGVRCKDFKSILYGGVLLTNLLTFQKYISVSDLNDIMLTDFPTSNYSFDTGVYGWTDLDQLACKEIDDTSEYKYMLLFPAPKLIDKP